MRSDLQYRTGFAVFVLAQLLITALDFATIWFIFGQTPALEGWSLEQVAFLYGFATLSFGVADLLVGSVEDVSVMVRTGLMDRYLTRPAGALMQVVGDRFVLRRLGRIAQAVAVLAWSMSRLEIAWDGGSISVFVVTLLAGPVIAGSVWVVTASHTFWLVNTQEMSNAFTYGGHFAISYPLSVLESWLRVLLAYIIPLAFISYFPALAILDAPDPLETPEALRYLTLPVAFMSAAIARIVWRFGLSHYQSTGS